MRGYHSFLTNTHLAVQARQYAQAKKHVHTLLAMLEKQAVENWRKKKQDTHLPGLFAHVHTLLAMPASSELDWMVMCSMGGCC